MVSIIALTRIARESSGVLGLELGLSLLILRGSGVEIAAIAIAPRVHVVET
jgi:hypothetical protein